MTVYAITDTKKGRTVIAPTYLQTTHELYPGHAILAWPTYIHGDSHFYDNDGTNICTDLRYLPPTV